MHSIQYCPIFWAVIAAAGPDMSSFTPAVAGLHALWLTGGHRSSDRWGEELLVTAFSSHIKTRRMSLEHMSGPLCGMPACTTPNTHVDNSNVVPEGEQTNKTAINVSGVTVTRGFLIWLGALCPSRLSAQITMERLVIVSETSDGFRDSLCDPLMGARVWAFTHSFSGEIVVCVCCLKTSADKCLREPSGRSLQVRSGPAFRTLPKIDPLLRIL
jgi:hypothetical protein